MRTIISINSFLLICLAFCLTQCANTSLRTRTKAEIKTGYFADQPLADLSSKKIDVENKRSKNIILGFMEGASIEVTPVVGSALYAKKHEAIQEKAFKEKLSAEQVKDEEAKVKFEIAEELKRGRCFTVNYKTSDKESYANENEWHGAVILNDKEYPVKFSNFKALTYTSITMSHIGSHYSAYQTYAYNVFSTACTKEIVNLDNGFKLRIEPRYKKGIDPVELIWASPGSLENPAFWYQK